MVKTLKLIIKKNIEDLAGCVRERKRYRTNIKKYTKPFPQSMNKQCNKYARKSDATNIEYLQINKKLCQQTNANNLKTRYLPRKSPGGSLTEHYNLNRLPQALQKNNLKED